MALLLAVAGRVRGQLRAVRTGNLKTPSVKSRPRAARRLRWLIRLSEHLPANSPSPIWSALAQASAGTWCGGSCRIFGRRGQLSV